MSSAAKSTARAHQQFGHGVIEKVVVDTAVEGLGKCTLDRIPGAVSGAM